jgi:site-specific DNA-methyltransferase (adenine-specific)
MPMMPLHLRKTPAASNGLSAALTSPLDGVQAVLNGVKNWHVAAADAIDFLASLPADSVDLCFFSPPYTAARLYLEDGCNLGIARDAESWASWMLEVFIAARRVCMGAVCCVCEGQTRNYRWDTAPALLMADLHRSGFHLRRPCIYHRVGIPGSGGPDYFRNDAEYIVVSTRGGKLPWADPTACGQPPKYRPGGAMSYRTKDGNRVNALKKRGPNGYASGDLAPLKDYTPPKLANPGNLIHCAVGGGRIGNPLAHENEAPFPEALAERFIRSFCPPDGIVCDPFCGSGTTLAVALRHGRRAIGSDLRPSQVKLTARRVFEVIQ